MMVNEPRGPGVPAVDRQLESMAQLSISLTWMFSVAPRSTFFLGGMLTG